MVGRKSPGAAFHTPPFPTRLPLFSPLTAGSRAAIDGRITAGDTIVSLNGVPLETEPGEAPADLEMRGQSFDIFARSKSVPSQGAGLSFAKAARQKLSISRAANNMRWLRRQKTLVPLFSTACTYEESWVDTAMGLACHVLRRWMRREGIHEPC